MIADDRVIYHDYGMQILTDKEILVGSIGKLADCFDFHAKLLKNV